MTAPGPAALRRRAFVLLAAGFTLAAAATAFPLTSGPGRTLAGRLPDAAVLLLALGGAMGFGHVAGRYRLHPMLQGIGVLLVIVVPVALILAALLGVMALAGDIVLAALVAWGMEARRAWAPNLLLALPLGAGAMTAISSLQDGGTFADAVEATLVGVAAIASHELVRHGDAFRDILRDVAPPGEADAPTRRELAHATSRATLDSLVLSGGLLLGGLVLLYGKETLVGDGDASRLLGDSAVAVPLLLTLLGLTLVGALLLQRGARDEDAGP